MADSSRYSGRYAPAPGRRSPTLYNPARSSVPIGVNYAPYNGDPYAPDPYASDIHVLPVSHHDTIMTGRSAGDFRTNSIPVTKTTYAVRKDREPGVSRSASVRDSGSSRPHRSSTIDTSSKRPPIIVTTKHTPTASESHASSNTRSDSPTRDSYRSSEERYYTQPGTSIHRARSTNRAGPYSAAPLQKDDYARLRERTGDDRLRAADPYRPPRQAALYPYEPRHSGAAIDYGNEGYEYTKPSDLARYDLDTTRPPRASRRESFDRGYYRPSVSVSTDIGGHPYEPNERRSRGPPPTSRGLDRLNRSSAAGIYDAPGIRMPVPPPAPLAPPRHLGVPGSPKSERRSSSRTRPVSLYQDSYGYMQPDDLSRSYDDKRSSRDRDYFHDDVATRGFGLRVDPKDDGPRREPDPRYRDERRDRREPRTDDRDPRRRRSDEEFESVKKREERPDRANLETASRKDDRRPHDDLGANPRRRSDEEWEFVPRKEERKQQKGSLSPPGIKVIDDDAEPRSRRDDARDRREKDRSDRPEDDGRDSSSTKDKVKEKVVAGLGLAAASIGLGSARKDKDDRDDKRDRPSKRQSRDSDDLRSWESGEDDPRVADRNRSSRREADDRRRSSRDEPELVEAPRDRDNDRPRREHAPEVITVESRDRNRREAEAALTGEPVEKTSRDASTSSVDDKSSRPRRKVRSSFNPNDAAALAALKAELAASEQKDRRPPPSTTNKDPSPDRTERTERSERTERRHSAQSSPDRDDPSLATALVPVPKDEQASYDDRGREIVPAPSSQQVRVVSPPRAKDEKKPVKGILKQPKPQFPEEPNPVREGVAPHKDDKKKADVPPGARWTKINRALVNPEALTIGKERFEVRDDFVIVLRVLSKEEIQAYATATAQLRERKRLEYERAQKEADYNEPEEKDDDDDRRRRHKHHRRDRGEDEYVDERRERDRDYDRDREDRDKDREHRRSSRRHRDRGDADYDYDDVEERDRPKAIEYNGGHGGHEHKHHRSHRVGE